MANKRNNRSRNGRGSAPRRNSKPRVDKKEQALEARTASQSKTYDMIKFDASNIFFNNILGTNVGVGETPTGRLPGFLIFHSGANFVTRSNMINVAGTSIYTWVRHANAGRVNYEASDSTLYLIALSEVLVGIQELIRVYGYANYFRARNLYSAHVITGLGFEEQGLRDNLANARYSINLLINKLKSFALPKVFNYFDERLSEYSYIYVDEPSEEAQYIVVRPSVLYEFDATTYETGGALVPVDNSGIRNFVQQVERIDGMLDALRANEDMNIISGDMLKAYGTDLYHLDPIDPDYQLDVVYDELVISQFQNGHYVPDLEFAPLTQEDNKLSTVLMLMSDKDRMAGSFLEGKTRLLNSPVADIDANMIYALGKYQIVTESIGNSLHCVASANTTILYKPFIMTFSLTEEENSLVSRVIPQFRVGTVSFVDITYLSKWKSHYYLWQMDYGLPIGDVHHAAKISAEDTLRMNDARFMLSFQTLQMG